MRTLWSDRKYHYSDERQEKKEKTLGENKEKIPVHLILMKADATVKNKRPSGIKEKKFESKTQIESDRT